MKKAIHAFQNDSSFRIHCVLVLTIIAVFSVLLKWTLGTGLQCDELLYLRAIELGPFDSLMNAGSSHPPLGRWIIGLFLSAESPDWLLRTPSIIASLLTIVVWFKILQRVISDNRLIMVLLPLMAFGRCWLEIAYQMTPYAFLTLFVSLHCLCWLRLLEKSTWDRVILFIVTGSVPFWTHFYGLNLLVADQIIWILLIWRNRSFWKLWLSTSIAIAVLTAPVFPILLFYMRVEKPYAIVQIDNYFAYFIGASTYFFARMTFNFGTILPFVLLWYGIAATFIWKWVRNTDFKASSNRNAESENPATSAALTPLTAAVIVMTGFFLTGFPAAQGHSLLSGKAMWSRYAVMSTWIHWPMLALFLHFAFGQKFAYRGSLVGLAIVMIAFVPVGRIQQTWTYDHKPAIAELKEHSKPEDAFFAQDMDFWIGDANFDRLWFERYSPAPMKLVTGTPMGRFELAEKGIPLDQVEEGIDRVWVYSLLYTPGQLKKMQTDKWRLTVLRKKKSTYAFALFCRVQEDGPCPWRCQACK